jgi:hypothetical protein
MLHMMLKECDVKRKHVYDDSIAQSMVHEHEMEQETMKGVRVPHIYEERVRVPHIYEGG